jgi:hypothetical protein
MREQAASFIGVGCECAHTSIRTGTIAKDHIIALRESLRPFGARRLCGTRAGVHTHVTQGRIEAPLHVVAHGGR